MNLRPYLPSATFVVMVGALALSGGLVLAAQYATRAHQATLGATATPAPDNNWQQSLQDVVAESGVEVPQAPDPNTLQTLLTQAKTDNLTDQVSRSLLLTLSSYTSEGLGQDAPTQDVLLAQALAQINAAASSTKHTNAELTVVSPTNAALRTYGNKVMAVLLAHPEASVQDTYKALGQVADTGNAAALRPLAAIGAGYAAIARELLATPVPQTLAPFHLQLVNEYAAMAATYADLELMVDDPLRGMAAVRRYSSLTDETTRVLTIIAQYLNKDGILFTKDEPGTNWSGLLSS